jgi:hypothetical protein
MAKALGAFLLTTPFWTPSAAVSDVPLATDGRPVAQLVLSNAASRDEHAAAAAIREYVQRMSGARLFLRRASSLEPAAGGSRSRIIIAGPSCPPERWPAVGVRAEDIRLNGFAIVSDGRRSVVLIASDGPGIRFAAYALLEKLGVRWFMPTELGEVVPQTATVGVPPMRELQNPDFLSRSIWQDWADRPRKIQDDYAAWCDHNRLGGMSLDMGHNLANIIPPSVYFQDHPEYFPLINGERTVRGDWQPCTSNPEVVRIAAQAAIRFFDERPWAVCYSLSPNDGYGWCMCDACRALDPPEYRDEPNKGKGRRMVHFANAVAERLAKTHPDKYVAFYAYVGTIEPPTDVRAHPNVVVGLCHYGSVACFIPPIDAPDCQPNTDFRAIVEGWRKVTDRLVAREYFTALCDPPTGPAGVARAFTLLRDIPWYRDHGFMGLNSQMQPAWGMYGLNFYLAARLAWDADLDQQALLADYFARFYGPAGPKMREYFEFMAATALSRAHGGSSVPVLTDDDTAHGVALVDEAHALARTEAQRRRVALSRAYLEYVQATRRFAADPSETTWAQIQRVADQHMDDLAMDYRLHQHLYGGTYQPNIGGVGRYEAESLRPIGLGPAPAASYEVALPLRGPHGLLIWAEQGEDVWVSLTCDQLGSYYDPLAYELHAPEGATVARGSVGIRQTRDVQVAALRTGIYNLVVGAGQNRALVKVRNQHAVLKGRSVHFSGEAPRLHFFVPEGVRQFTVRLTTESPLETGVLGVYDPAGRLAFEGDTVKASVLTAPVDVPPDGAGRAWSLEVRTPPGGVCDDVFIELGEQIPPYLATAAERLVVPTP